MALSVPSPADLRDLRGDLWDNDPGAPNTDQSFVNLRVTRRNHRRQPRTGLFVTVENSTILLDPNVFSIST